MVVFCFVFSFTAPLQTSGPWENIKWDLKFIRLDLVGLKLTQKKTLLCGVTVLFSLPPSIQAVRVSINKSREHIVTTRVKSRILLFACRYAMFFFKSKVDNILKNVNEEYMCQALMDIQDCYCFFSIKLKKERKKKQYTVFFLHFSFSSNFSYFLSTRPIMIK